MPSFAVILPAAGQSRRFGGNKLLADLAGQTVLNRTLAVFLARADVACIVIAAAEDLPISSDDPRIVRCAGGTCRAGSVLNALRHVPEHIELAAVHDAARPLVSRELIDRTLAAAVEFGAAVPALAATATIKQAAGPLPARVEKTLPRNSLWAVQTPQIARRRELLAALEHCPLPLEQVTDDAQALELAGRPVMLVAGEERNLKITHAMDLEIARLYLADQVRRDA